jgi:hypothetical protein
MLMAQRKATAPTRANSTPTFADVTTEIARRNDEAQKIARQKRTAREKEQIATRRRWEQL